MSTKKEILKRLEAERSEMSNAVYGIVKDKLGHQPSKTEDNALQEAIKKGLGRSMWKRLREVFKGKH